MGGEMGSQYWILVTQYSSGALHSPISTPTHINIYNVLHLNMVSSLFFLLSPNVVNIYRWQNWRALPSTAHLWHGVMPSMKRKETTRRKMTAQPTYTAAPIREMDTAQKRTFIDLDLNSSHWLLTWRAVHLETLPRECSTLAVFS